MKSVIEKLHVEVANKGKMVKKNLKYKLYNWFLHKLDLAIQNLILSARQSLDPQNISPINTKFDRTFIKFKLMLNNMK